MTILLTATDQEILERAVQLGLAHAASGISGMIGRPVQVRALRVSILHSEQIADRISAGEESVVGISLTLGGDWSARVILLFDPDHARELVDLLLGQPRGTTRGLDDMSRSALAEVGNVMGAFFAGSIADLAGALFVPSTPIVEEAPARALLDRRLADLGSESDSVLLIETVIAEDPEGIGGYFLVVPDPSQLQHLVDTLRNNQ